MFPPLSDRGAVVVQLEGNSEVSWTYKLYIEQLLPVVHPELSYL